MDTGVNFISNISCLKSAATVTLMDLLVPALLKTPAFLIFHSECPEFITLNGGENAQTHLLLPSLGVMKPKPFSGLNHFTKPVIFVVVANIVAAREGRPWAKWPEKKIIRGEKA